MTSAMPAWISTSLAVNDPREPAANDPRLAQTQSGRSRFEHAVTGDVQPGIDAQDAKDHDQTFGQRGRSHFRGGEALFLRRTLSPPQKLGQSPRTPRIRAIIVRGSSPCHWAGLRVSHRSRSAELRILSAAAKFLAFRASARRSISSAGASRPIVVAFGRFFGAACGTGPAWRPIRGAPSRLAAGRRVARRIAVRRILQFLIVGELVQHAEQLEEHADRPARAEIVVHGFQEPAPLFDKSP